MHPPETNENNAPNLLREGRGGGGGSGETAFLNDVLEKIPPTHLY